MSQHDEHTDHTAHRNHTAAATTTHDHGAMSHDHAAPHEDTGHGGHEDHAGHGGHGGHGDHVGQFRRLFWIMLLLAVPVVGFSTMFSMSLGYPLPDAAWVAWVTPSLGTVMNVWGGAPFLTGAVGELRARKPGMMLLIALAITVAFLASWGASIGLLHHELDFWWELALLIVIMLLGHWIEMRSLAQTTSALDSLAALLPDEAEKVDGDTTVTVAPADLQVGDVVVVRPGGRVPADGRIVQGSASMDESMITGESRPVRRSDGDPVIAGTVATDSGVRVEITAIGEDTALAGIQKLVTEAQSSSSRAQRLADEAAGWLFWFALGAAAITAIVWTLVGQPEAAVIRTITVLVIACPHALGLAIPLVVSIATERAARGGVLIKDRLALESMRTVDTILFDKTGTLTKGTPAVTAIDPVTGADADQLLAWAAAAEADSEHPLARAIVNAAKEKNLTVPQSTDFESSPAVGVRARVDGHVVQVGGPYMLEQEHAVELPVADEWRGEGAIILHVLVDGQVTGALRLADEIRSESRHAVDALHERGVQVVMITGDADAVAASVAGELGIDRYFAGVRPEDKASKVKELQHEGRKVAMVGDGVNDAPALAQADVGIAIGTGTDIAMEASDVTLVSGDLRAAVRAVELSRATLRTIHQNLFWAFIYNILLIPVAMAGALVPMLAAGAMAFSSVFVVSNSLRLRGSRRTLQASSRSIGT